METYTHTCIYKHKHKCMCLVFVCMCSVYLCVWSSSKLVIFFSLKNIKITQTPSHAFCFLYILRRTHYHYHISWRHGRCVYWWRQHHRCSFIHIHKCTDSNVVLVGWCLRDGDTEMCITRASYGFPKLPSRTNTVLPGFNQCHLCAFCRFTCPPMTVWNFF